MSIRLFCSGLAISTLISCSAPPAAPVTASEVSQKNDTEKSAVTEAAPVPLSPAQAQRLALSAVDLLEAGNEDQAKTDLQRALAADPGNKLAQNLMRQITVNPIEALGRESFSYRVQPNETLSRISGRFLGDIYSFYLLARYNDIKVPRQVAGGQVIRIPGKAPAPGMLLPAATATPGSASPAEPGAGEKAMRQAEQLERSGDLENALIEYRKAAALDQSQANEKAEQVRRKILSRYIASARTAFAKQDLDNAVRNWDRVLAMDPNNETAKLERQKAITLREKVKSFK